MRKDLGWQHAIQETSANACSSLISHAIKNSEIRPTQKGQLGAKKQKNGVNSSKKFWRSMW